MRPISLAILLLTQISAAFADDAALTLGGNPRALAGHKSVRMVRERVVITVEKEGSRYDCTFVFRNEGPTCNVRIGFPDRGDGANETGYFEDVAEAKEKHRPIPAFELLHDFESYVDGKRVETKLIPVRGQAASWHTKTVKFERGATHTIRDTFTVGLGIGATASGGYAQMRSYIMSSGASWKGTIGEAEVLVRFAPNVIPSPVKPIAISKTLGPGQDALSYKRWPTLSKSAVFWSGFAAPTAKGRELRFYRKNFEPSERSDIWIFFGWRKNTS